MSLPLAPLGPDPRLRSGGAAGPRAPRVAVGAGKGGVGTSTVTALLACTAAAAGSRVLLVDLAPHFGGLAELLDVRPGHTLADVKAGLPPETLAVAVTPSLSLINAARVPDQLTDTEHQLMLRRLAGSIGGYDLVLIDAGASAASLRSAVRFGATRALTVTTHDRISLTATYAVLKLLHEQAPELRVDVIANRVSDTDASRLHEYLNAASVRFLARTVPFGGSIPDDPAFARTVATLGADEAAHGSPAFQVVRNLGEQLLADTGAPPFLRLLRQG
ncbi:MAG: P-loop NTPase [Gemmatimonadetes bacterium]|nr:P-loop NTPase [Gemmatimonadota bacterium]